MFTLLLTLVSYIPGSEGVGTTAFPILKIGYGPRACAMGETFVALANDVTALWWNPAGIAKIKRGEVFFCHQEWFAGIRDEYIGSTFMTPYGRFGASLLYSGTDDIDVYTGEWQREESISAYSGILFLSYGGEISDKLSVGTTLKGIYEDLKQGQGKAFCFDIGGLYSLSEQWRFGFNLQNVGPYVMYGENKYYLPLNFRIGICNKPLDNVNILCDFNLPNDNTPEYHIGAETWLMKMLALRTGYRGGVKRGSEQGLTAGVGVNWKGWGVDYAFVPYGDLGKTHRISLKMALPEVKKETWLVIKVIDDKTEEPLEASLKISGLVETYGLTNPVSGEYKIHNPGTGYVSILVSKEHYHSQSEDLHIHKDKNFKKTFRLIPIKAGILKGCIYSARTKEPIRASIRIMKQVIRNESSGKYAIEELKSGEYELVVVADDPFYLSKSCKVTIEQGVTTEKDFYLFRQGEKIVLRDINFETGKATLLPNSYTLLDSIGKFLLKNQELAIEVAGHTDPRTIHAPEFASNMELSLARAEIVREYLIKNCKIDAERLIARGYADTKPIASNETEEGMAKNRRTEFRIIR